jgi:hypothetical protein
MDYCSGSQDYRYLYCTEISVYFQGNGERKIMIDDSSRLQIHK